MPGGAREAAAWGRTRGMVMRPGEAPVWEPAVWDTSLKATHSRGTLPLPSPLPSPRQEHLAVAGGGQERTTHGFPGHLLPPKPPLRQEGQQGPGAAELLPP